MEKASRKKKISPPSLNLKTLILIIAVFFISLGQLQRIQIANTVAIYAHDLFIILFVALTILSSQINKKSISAFFRRWRFLCLFILWSLSGLFINQFFSGFSIIPWMYFSRLFSYLLFGLCINNQIKSSSIDQKWVLLMFKIMLFVFLAIGLFQYLLIPDLRFLGEGGWDVHYYRLAGNMLDPNFTGMLLINLLLTYIISIKNRCKNKLYLGLILVLSIALTYSRSSYLAFATTTCITLIFSRISHFQYRKILYFLFCVLLVLIPFLPQPGGAGVNLTRTETISSRVEVNESVINQLDFHQLILGKGLFTPSINTSVSNQIIHAKFPDNLFVFLLSSTGVLGLFFALSFIIKELHYAYHAKKYLVVLLLIGTITHSMFNLTILEPINLLVLLFCLQINLIANHQPLRLLKKVKS